MRTVLLLMMVVLSSFNLSAQSDLDPFINDFLFRFGAFPQGPPNDPMFDRQWNLERIRADRVWHITQGEGIVIAVVDTGIDYTHEDLSQNIWINAGEDLNGNGLADEEDYNGVDDDGNGFVDDLIGWNFADQNNDPRDTNGHGTRVSGIIAAVGNNETGIIGVAPRARIMPLKILGDQSGGSEEEFAAAYDYAIEMGAHIIHNSLTAAAYNIINPVLENAVRRAVNAGVMVVFTVSNQGDKVKFYSPQNMLETVTVGQADFLDRKTIFSQTGEFIDVIAPGTQILTTVPGNRYELVSAPSFSAPHVSALAALIMSAYPEFDIQQVRSMIRAGAADILPYGYDMESGFGRINVEASVTMGVPLHVVIDSPVNYDFVSSDQEQIEIRGTVAGDDLIFHLIYYSNETVPRNWQAIRAPSRKPIVDDVLATWNVAGFKPGNYWIRLQAMSRRGRQFNHYIQIALEPPFLRVAPESRFQSRPNLSHHRLVWEDNRSGIPQILLYDALSKEQFPVKTEPSLQFWPAISGPNVIWEGRSFGNPDVFYQNLETGFSRRIPNEIADQFESAISGSLVVWTDYRKGNANIYLFDLETNREHSITRNPAAQFAPEIDGSRIVWMDLRNGNWDIYMADFSDCPVLDRCPVIQITENEAAQTTPEISGERIVWTDFRHGNPQIYLFDLNEGKEMQITDASGFRSRPVISQNRIAWQDYRNGNWDIFYYDINTGEEHPLVTDEGDQTEPTLSGRYLAWSDHRFLNWHVYLHEFPDLNRAPVIHLDPPSFELKVGVPFERTFQVNDPDEEPVLNVFLEKKEGSNDLPEGVQLIKIDGETYRIEWTPNRRQAGVHTFLLLAGDGRMTATQELQFSVTDGAQLSLVPLLNDRREFKIGDVVLALFLLSNEGEAGMNLPTEVMMELFHATDPEGVPITKGRFRPPLLKPGESSFFGMHFILKETGDFLIRASMDELKVEYPISVLP